MRDKKRDEINKKRYIMRDEIDQKECKNNLKINISPLRPPPPLPQKKKKSYGLLYPNPAAEL